MRAAANGHERHLHARGPGVSHPEQGAPRSAYPRDRDGRLPACRDPRGHQREHGRARDATSQVRMPAALCRERRRQPRRELLARARRLHYLRH